MASGDIETYATAFGMDTEVMDPLSLAMIETMLKNFDYEMGEVAEEGEAATVEVTVTNINTMALVFAMYGVVDENASEEEQMAAALAVCDGDVDTFTETATVYFTKTEEGWMMDEELSADFASVIAGIPTTTEDDFGFGEILEDVEAETEAE